MVLVLIIIDKKERGVGYDEDVAFDFYLFSKCTYLDYDFDDLKRISQA